MKPDMRETSERLATQARCQAGEAERGRVLRVEAAQEHLKACRAISWRTRFSQCERLLLQAKARLEACPDSGFFKEEVATLERCYRELLAEQPQP